jgi:hypothetical protein
VRQIIAAIEARFGQSNRVWVMDRGMISEDTLAFLNEPGHLAKCAGLETFIRKVDPETGEAGPHRGR